MKGTALVTGAGRGIGAAIARRLAEDGYGVIVNYARSEEAARAVVAEIEAKGGRALAVRADVSNEADVRSLVAKAVEAFGPIEALVNNAGLFKLAPLGGIDREHFASQFETNVFGMINVVQAAMDSLAPGARIVNIGSVVSFHSPGGMAVYSATKAAIATTTAVFAKELGPRGISINTLAPGATATEMFADVPPEMADYIKSRTPMGRFGTPEDVARAASLLLSEDAAWITGQTIEVSGGLVF